MSGVRAVRTALAAVLALTAGLVSAVAVALAFAPAALAAAPTGGCWVWYYGDPPSNISTGLAPWTDTSASPAGPADHTITLAPSDPAPGETVTATYSFNKGPKNSGPAADVTGTFSFSANGQTLSASKAYGTVAGGKTIPATTLTVQFVAVEGVNTVTLTNAVFKVPSPFLVEIDCNGQSTGNSTTNPRTSPQATNITASVTGSGASVSPSLTASPSASTSQSATASTSPSESESTSPSASDSTSAAADPGSPAKGKADFACTLDPLGTDFDYPATVEVSGYRAAEGDPVSLTADLSDLPGIAPLPIDGQMDVTLDLTVAGEKTTLEGGADTQAPAKTPVPVPPLTGEVDLDGDEAEVVVTGFTFDFPELSVGADCTADDSLGTMKVGSEPPDDSGGSGDSGGTSGGTSSSGGTLPQTGEPTSLPVIALWAGALLLLGAAGLVLLPLARPKGDHV